MAAPKKAYRYDKTRFYLDRKCSATGRADVVKYVWEVTLIRRILERPVVLTTKIQRRKYGRIEGVGLRDRTMAWAFRGRDTVDRRGQRSKKKL